MSTTPDLRRWLRRRLALLLLLLPAICTLPPFIAIAPAGALRLAALGIWGVLLLAAAIIVWQSLSRIRRG